MPVMTSITSQRSGSSTKRSRRRQQQRAKQLSKRFPHRRRNLRRSASKRQLREQSSDVDDCFEDCQERGYHIDQDIHVGSQVRKGNPFSALCFDQSSISSPDPIPSPYQDPTLRASNTFLTGSNWQTIEEDLPRLDEIDRDSLEPGTEEPITSSQLRKMGWSSNRSSNKFDASQSTRGSPSLFKMQAAMKPTVQTSGMLQSSVADAKIRSPVSLGQYKAGTSDGRPSKRCRSDNIIPALLAAEHCIPSPLLYHKRSQEELSDISEVNRCICLGGNCDCADCNLNKDEIPSYDCDSGRCSACEPDNGGRRGSFHLGLRLASGSQSTSTYCNGPVQPIQRNQNDVIAAPSPKSGPSATELLLKPDKVGVEPRYSTKGCSYISPRREATIARFHATELAESSSPRLARAKLKAHMACVKDEHATATAATKAHILPAKICLDAQDHDLIFPELPPASIGCQPSFDWFFKSSAETSKKTCTKEPERMSNAASLNKDTVNYIDDRPINFQILWQTYERAILGSKKISLPHSKSSRVYSGLKQLPPGDTTIADLSIYDPGTEQRLRQVTVNLTKPNPTNIKHPTTLTAFPSFSSRTELIPIVLHEKEYLGMAMQWDSDIQHFQQKSLPITNVAIEHTHESRISDNAQHAIDWPADKLEERRVIGEQSEDVANPSWLPIGWDKHLLYPQPDTSAASPSFPSKFEEINRGDVENCGDRESDDSHSILYINHDTNNTCDDDTQIYWTDVSEDEFVKV